MPTRKKHPKHAADDVKTDPIPPLPPAQTALEPQRQQALSRFIEAFRKAVVAALDLADTAAAKVTRL